ncbi:unnamed protein product [Lupinus luteus]|uniref:Uncharacterized protein n=1 Tax=Lupinus luteus TaxID=3873 RepID=A0AAV1WZP5_LUPLU
MASLGVESRIILTKAHVHQLGVGGVHAPCLALGVAWQHWHWCDLVAILEHHLENYMQCTFHEKTLTNEEQALVMEIKEFTRPSWKLWVTTKVKEDHVVQLNRYQEAYVVKTKELRNWLVTAQREVFEVSAKLGLSDGQVKAIVEKNARLKVDLSKGNARDQIHLVQPDEDLSWMFLDRFFEDGELRLEEPNGSIVKWPFIGSHVLG